MPKEMAHWILADLARKEKMGNKSTLMAAAEKHPEFYYLGAVAYDSAFYMTGRYSLWQGIANALHGYNSEDTFGPYRLLAEQVLFNKSPQKSPVLLKERAMSFMAGSLAHMAADCTFHPVVFYYAGDSEMPDEKARRGWLYRHRAFETALDCHMAVKYFVPYTGRLKSLARSVNERGADCLSILAAFFSGSGWKNELKSPAEGESNNVNAKDAGFILNTHVRSQEKFFNGSLKILAPVLFIGRRKTNADLSCLIYPAEKKKFQFFDGILQYRNPVTGSKMKDDLDSLVQSFLKLMNTLINDLEHSIKAGRTPFQGEIGPVLDTGIPGNHDQVKKYFLEPMDILKRLDW
jgi:hypothetical protein